MAIKLQNITYKNILKDINCTFEDGKICAILSANESEKEILSKILAGLIEDYGGKINNDYEGNNINYVYREPNDMFLGESVYDELSFSLDKYNYKDETKEKRINAILKMVLLDQNIKNINTSNISDGEKKLLSIAISLMTNPKILILNEPSMYLDDNHKSNIIKLLKKIAKRYNKIIIILTSDVQFAYEVCDNFLLLKDGIIIENSSKKNMLKITNKLINSSLAIPKIIDFINKAYNKKNISLEETFDIKELMKDIYRNVR